MANKASNSLPWPISVSGQHINFPQEGALYRFLLQPSRSLTGSRLTFSLAEATVREDLIGQSPNLFQHVPPARLLEACDLGVISHICHKIFSPLFFFAQGSFRDWFFPSVVCFCPPWRLISATRAALHKNPIRENIRKQCEPAKLLGVSLFCGDFCAKFTIYPEYPGAAQIKSLQKPIDEANVAAL